MKNKTGLIIGAIVVIFAIWCYSAYNGLVEKQESATTALSNVQATYQRRADLIPNLVNTVKGYATHERETFEAVTKARNAATQIHLDATDATPEKLAQYQKAQGDIAAALSRLIAVSERYPELKANENFKDLQIQLEGTENRINEARQKYNAQVQVYNVAVRKFPNNILAGIFGFERMNKFEADAGAQKAPTVNFE